MIRIASLAQLPRVHTCAVIINCDTNWYTTLALASCRTRTSLPILLIDCQSTAESRAHFRKISDRLGLEFFWLEWPLRPHGIALDALMAEIPASRVLLVDSDLEIVGEGLVHSIVSALDAEPNAYAAGLLHPAGWMDPPAHALPPATGYHMERMWIPLVRLDVEKVRVALAAGESFLAMRDHTELGGGWIARVLFHRFRLPVLRRLRLPRASRRGLPRAAWFEYDTGARVHRMLRERGFGFAVPTGDYWSQVRHYHGATRARLGNVATRLAQWFGLMEREGDRNPDAGLAGVQQDVIQRYPEFARALDLRLGTTSMTDSHSSGTNEPV